MGNRFPGKKVSRNPEFRNLNPGIKILGSGISRNFFPGLTISREKNFGSGNNFMGKACLGLRLKLYSGVSVFFPWLSRHHPVPMLSKSPNLAQLLKLHSIEVEADISEKIALDIWDKTGYSFSWCLKNKSGSCFLIKASSVESQVFKQCFFIRLIN